MKNVLLVTQGFPYGTSEQGFLPTEYQRLAECFQLSLLSFDTTSKLTRPLSPRVVHERYCWPSRPSPLGVMKQLLRPEVRADIALLRKSRGSRFLWRALYILVFSHRAEQTMRPLRRIIRENRIDTVYTYWCTQAAVAAIRLKKEFPSLKVVSRFHGIDLYIERTYQGWQPLRPYIARCCDRLIFICQTGREYFLSHWGREWAGKSSVIHVGCRAMPRCEAAGVTGNRLVLVSCSSVIPVKRVARIVDGLAALPEEVAVDWHHFGGGELSEALAAHAAARLANRPQIHYTLHGAIPNELLPQAYLDVGAQLFITTSESEGLPVSMMEAFAMGIPVVATAVGGIPEMVRPGETGYLLSEDPDAAEVAEAIQRYAALPECERRGMSEQTFACWRTDYDAARNAEKLVDLLNQTMEGTK